MIIETVSLKDLSPADYRKCHSLNARSMGDMQRAIKIRYNNNKPGTVVMAKDGDQLLGWGFAFWSTSPYVDWGRYPQGHFYVRKENRQQGIARKLMIEMIKTHKKLRVYPHDEQSAYFFSEFRTSVVTNNDNGWLRKKQFKLRCDHARQADQSRPVH